MRDAGHLPDACPRSLVSPAGRIHIAARSDANGGSATRGLGNVDTTGLRLLGFCLVFCGTMDFSIQPGESQWPFSCAGTHVAPLFAQSFWAPPSRWAAPDCTTCGSSTRDRIARYG